MKRAFTMAEVLIVVAIIAILGAIALPVYSTAKRSAQNTGCVSNLRQLGLALGLYANDNQGWAPPWGTRTSWASNETWIDGQPQKWRDALAYYAGKNHDIFWCGLDTHKKDPKFLAIMESVHSERAMVTSYPMDPFVLMPEQFGGRDGVMRLSPDIGLSHPRADWGASKTAYITDAVFTRQVTEDNIELASAHGSRTNRLYCDGHVASKPIEE